MAFGQGPSLYLVCTWHKSPDFSYIPRGMGKTELKPPMAYKITALVCKLIWQTFTEDQLCERLPSGGFSAYLTYIQWDASSPNVVCLVGSNPFLSSLHLP